MAKYKPISIRQSLIALIVIMTIVPLVILVYSALMERRHQEKDAIDDTAIQAGKIGMLFNQLTNGSELLLNTLSRLQIVQKRDEKTVNSLLIDMVNQYPQFSSIFMLDKSGLRWASTNPIKGPVSYADRKYFVNAISSGRFSSGEYAVGRVKGRPIISFALPVRDASRTITGVAVASIELDSLRAMSAEKQLVEGMSVIILDYKGTILFNSAKPELNGTQEQESVFRLIKEGPVEKSLKVDVDNGRNRILSYKKLQLPEESSPYMYVRVEIDHDQIMKEPNQRFAGNMAIMLIATSLSLLIVFRFSERYMLDKVDESEMRHQTLFETSLHGIIYHNPDGEIILANPMAKMLLGESKENRVTATSGNALQEYIHEDGTPYPATTHPAVEALASGAAVQNRIMGVLQPADERYHWIKISAMPMFSKGGAKPYMVYTIFEDITSQRQMEYERREMEHQLLEAQKLESKVLRGMTQTLENQKLQLNKINESLEQRVKERTTALEQRTMLLETMSETTIDGILMLGNTGEVILYNNRFSEIWGIPKDILLERKDTTLLDFVISQHKYPEEFTIKITWLYGHQDQKSRDIIELADGRSLDRHSSPLINAAGDYLGRAWFFRDITDRMQAEASLHESNERFLCAFENAPSLMAITNLLDGKCLNINKRFLEVSGFRKEEVIGKTFTEIGWILPSEREQIVNAMKSEGHVNNLELTHYTKSGTPRIFYYSGQLIMLEGEKRLLSNVIDITEQRMIERQLLHSQKLESVGRLAGGIAHDFNNKLSVILGYAELAGEELPDTANIGAYLREITRAGVFSRDIAAQLLAFSRQQITSPRIVNINSTVDETQKSLSRMIGEDVHLNFHPCEDIWPIRIDPVQIDQIIMNLAVNARDAMPEGGALTIETANHPVGESEVVQTGHPQGDYVMISVSDTGCGMDEETMSHIFEPFFTTKEVGKGTGLGLATIHGIVTQNDGFIDFDSTPGRGTVFRILFPRCAEEVVAAAPVETVTAKATGSILLVEDDDDVRKVTAILLERLGYKVTPCATPHKAIQCCKDYAAGFDLVITDIVMPGMNGKEMIECIKAIKHDIKVLYMSGYSSEIISQKGMLAANVNFIQKPLDTSELKRKTVELLNS